MRLLDLIAQGEHVLWAHSADGSAHRLGGAGDHAQRLRACPLRYVLSDDLARICAGIGYSDGMRLTECIDLLRAPAQRVWVEWCDEVREREYLRAGGTQSQNTNAPPAMRAGLLIAADASGRRGSFNTFWSTREHTAEVHVAALTTHFDFDDPEPTPGTVGELLAGHPVALLRDDTLAPLMRCVRYRFTASWAQYYSRAALGPQRAAHVVRASLATVANDLPMLLALLLLFATDAGVAPLPTDLTRLNRKRCALGKPPLLEHVVISLPLPHERRLAVPPQGDASRRAPRWHHVRGHLVRRGSAIYWRAPHWRGHMRLGVVKTRTVELRAAETPRLHGGAARD
jgi:hypothetical protein